MDRYFIKSQMLPDYWMIPNYTMQKHRDTAEKRLMEKENGPTKKRSEGKHYGKEQEDSALH